MMTKTFDVLADFNQICLLDGDVQPPYSEDITDEDIAHRYKVVPHLIAVYTATADYVAFTVALSDSPKKLEVDQWQHVVELQVELPSGKPLIAGCTNYLPDCPVVEMAPGSYVARIKRHASD